VTGQRIIAVREKKGVDKEKPPSPSPSPRKGEGKRVQE